MNMYGECQKCKRGYLETPVDRMKLCTCYHAYMCIDCLNDFDDFMADNPNWKALRILEMQLNAEVAVGNSSNVSGNWDAQQIQVQQLKKAIKDWLNS